ncbi:GDP-mannose mannosyl hydrolase [Paraburkholderia sp.]|jgi:colanic acid biosynthesis protein WcaH|uniref:GDP-mannose mannosyl hydrolase n=1 Tax=Paraburkholderia sp. TaxID=1926495 RepID=UPI002F42394E
MLARPEFLDVVRLTPLISIDLIVVDDRGRVLLGRRVNRPARGTWFVPGGRIHKDESLNCAFSRIVREEIGLENVAQNTACFRGVFEHHYDDNFAGAADISTHYIVLGYMLMVRDAMPVERLEQHSDYVWMAPSDLLACAEVHENTKAYFR